MNLLIIVFVVLTLIVMFMFTYGKRVQMDRLSILLDCKDWEQFDKVADSFLTKALVKHFDLESIKLNSYIMRKDTKKIDEQFDLLSKASKSDIKDINITVRGFEYYVYEKNRNKAAEYLSHLEKVADKSVTSFCKREYDILIDGATNYIPQLEKEIKESGGQKKYVLAYLLKLSYENDGNGKKAREIEKKYNFK